MTIDSDLILKQPPNNVDAEYAIIGALLSNNDLIDDVPSLKHEHFYTNANATIYRAISAMIAHNKEVDIVTLADFLDRKKKLDEVGGIGYITEIVVNNRGTKNFKRYAEIVIEKYKLRQLLALSNDIQSSVYDGENVSETIEQLSAKFIAISESSQTNEPKLISELLPERMDMYDKRFNGEIVPVSTGLVDLDAKLNGGLESGDLVIIAGRPSMGKTALGVQIGEAMQRDDKATAIFTCEMPNEQIVDRVVTGVGRINNHVIKTGKFENEDWDKLATAIGKISSMNIFIDDTSYSLNEIASKSRVLQRKHGLGCIVVDYIGLLDGDGDTREQKISAISRGFKRLAKELKIPIILLSQLNRKLEERSNKRPMMSDLRESGAIEQDADIIIFVYRDEVYNADSQDKGTAELIIAKHRGGATGSVRVGYVGQYTRFENYAGGQYFNTHSNEDDL